MAILNLTGQALARDQIQPKLIQLWGLMQDRKIIWDKISFEKRKKWIQVADTKDPIMALAWDIYTKLRDNFFGPDYNEVED